MGLLCQMIREMTRDEAAETKPSLNPTCLKTSFYFMHNSNHKLN